MTTNKLTQTYLSRMSVWLDACIRTVCWMLPTGARQEDSISMLSETELIWFGSRVSLKKLTEDDFTLQFDSGSVHPVSVVRDLGVMLDCELSMKQHVTKVASSCFYHLHRLKQISRLSRKTRHGTAGLSVHPLSPRLLQCSACGVPRATTDPLQRVQNAAARLVLNLRLRDHVTPALKQLH